MSNPRITCVNSLRVQAISNSGVCIIGDAFQLAPKSNVLAVARQWPIFLSREGDLSQFPLFDKPIPLPSTTQPLTMHTHHHSPIRVGNVTVVGIAASAIIQLGSNRSIDMEARVKHIRHLLVPPKEELKTQLNVP